MKKNRLLQQLIFAAFIIILTSSCKKENATVQCHIITAVYTNSSTTTTWNISYQNGKPSMISNPAGESVLITYDNNTVTSIAGDSYGAFVRKVVATLNSDNKIVNARTFYDVNGTDWDNVEIVYDSNGNLLKETYTASSGSPSITTYTVSNGDIVTATTDGTDTTVFEFYDDKEYQEGDLLGISSLINYGVEGYLKNAHLVKSIFSGGGSTPTQINYEMNDKGFVSKVSTSNTPYPFSYSYEYDCK